MKSYRIFILFAALYCTSSNAAQHKLYFIESKNSISTSLNTVKEQLQSQLTTAFPSAQYHEKLNLDKQIKRINISFGAKALATSLKQSLVVDVATLISQAEAISLIQKYPKQLQNTQIIVNGSTFQCQLDLFKKNHLKQKETKATVGILLRRQSKFLLSEIEVYAKKHSIKAVFLVLEGNDSIIRAFRYLMQQHPVVMTLADNHLDNSKDLATIYHQAKLMNKEIITASIQQQQFAVKSPCVIKNKTMFERILQIVSNQLNLTNSAKQPSKSLVRGYQVIVP